MLDFNNYEWISFDCYGTLVDWETGISDAVAGVFARHGVRKSQEEILALFSDAEPRVQSSGQFLEYRRVLRDVMQIMAWEASIRLPGRRRTPADSLPNWPVFPDAAEALPSHGCSSDTSWRFISNVDDDLFAGTVKGALGIDFDAVITSQQAGKLQAGLARLPPGAGADGPCHRKGKVAARRREPVPRHRPGQPMGIDSVWVNRPTAAAASRRTRCRAYFGSARPGCTGTADVREVKEATVCQTE